MQRGTTTVQAASIVLTLFGFWLLMSGYFTAFLLAAGAGSALAVGWLALRMEAADREGHPVHFSAAIVTYWPWLIKEIALSAWTVTKIIVTPSLPISPTLKRFRPSQKTTVGLVTHASGT